MWGPSKPWGPPDRSFPQESQWNSTIWSPQKGEETIGKTTFCDIGNSISQNLMEPGVY